MCTLGITTLPMIYQLDMVENNTSSLFYIKLESLLSNELLLFLFYFHSMQTKILEKEIRDKISSLLQITKCYVIYFFAF